MIYPIVACSKCRGTGIDAKATAEMKAKEPSLSGHVRCSLCNGNGVI